MNKYHRVKIVVLTLYLAAPGGATAAALDKYKFLPQQQPAVQQHPPMQQVPMPTSHSAPPTSQVYEDFRQRISSLNREEKQGLVKAYQNAQREAAERNDHGAVNYYGKLIQILYQNL